MSTMVVLAFKDETSAEAMRDKLVGLQKLQLISLSDAAVVVRRQVYRSADGNARYELALFFPNLQNDARQQIADFLRRSNGNLSSKVPS